MTESKIELTERLRSEGRWSAASKFKDVALKDFKAKGMKRHEAANAAWEAMATAFPPLESGGESTGNFRGQGGDDDLIDVDVFLERAGDRQPPDLTRDVLWVYEHLADRNAKPQEAPSLGAWSLLQWARRYRNRFFEQVLPKAMANRPPGEEEHVREAEMRAEEIEAVLRKFDRKSPT